MSTLLKTYSRGSLRCILGSAFMSALLWVTPAHAVLNDGFFELDGNTVDASGANLPDDWKSFVSGGTPLTPHNNNGHP